MTLASLVGVIGSLALVLGLLLLTLRVLKRVAPRISGTQRIPLALLQKLPVGPRQSIAIVRIGERVTAVSIGDGGVRLITDLGAADAVLIAEPPAPATTVGSFSKAFRSALRSAIKPVIVALFAVGSMSAVAQSQAVKPAQTATPGKAAPSATAPVAKLDSMAARLAPQLQLSVGNDKAGGMKMSGTVGIVVMMGLLTLLPALVLMMTGFTRIFIVMHFLRQAIGAQSAPPAQLVAGMSLLLTLFVMAPTLDDVNTNAITPWMDGKIDQAQMLKEGAKPFREFMLRQTRESDLATFVDLSHMPRPASVDDVPLVVLTSAFVTSELRVSFQIGFALFLPFIVIDVVVASVLMSMGMMMVPPAMISLPFKLLLFVLVDGWSLVIHSLVQSFH